MSGIQCKVCGWIHPWPECGSSALDMATIRAVEEAYAECEQIAKDYDRQPFPGFEAGVNLVKTDIAYRIRKAAQKVRKA